MKNAAKPQLVAIAIVVALTSLVAGILYYWTHSGYYLILNAPDPPNDFAKY